MRSKKNVETITLEENQTLNKAFDSYLSMAENAVDWTLFCTYQLKPNFTEGNYKILQLPSMQIVYTSMSGGVMFDYVVPEGCIVFSVMKNISHKACIEQMKLETGMIAVTDDSKIYNFMCSDKVELLDVSLKPEADATLLQALRKVIDCYVVDAESKMTTLLMDVVNTYAEEEHIDAKSAEKIEQEMTRKMLQLLENEEVHTPRFTKSEMIALEIKCALFQHMDHTMSVSEIAQKYGISEKSLQNSFKALFDLTPNQYMRLLKLNLVHHDLVRGSASKTAVWKIAQKWGFRHMGRFSKYYKELFGENPSETLRNPSPIEDGMKVHCVERQEQMY